MSNNDPFNNNGSRFGGRPKLSSEQNIPQPNNIPPGFPQLPKPETGQGKVNIPLPQLPGANKEPASFPTLPSPLTNTPKPVITPLEEPAPTFVSTSTRPEKGTSNDLFGETQKNIEEDYDEEEEEDYYDDEELEEELSDEETYQQVFGEEMPEDFDPEKDITDEEDIYLSNIFEASAVPVAANQTLYALLSNPNWQVRMALADNPEIPAEILSRLSEDEDENVRQSVMENDNCPDDVYRNFAYDEDDLLISEWIEMDRTTSDMLTPLHKTDNYVIASSLVESGKIPFSIKMELERKLNQ